MSQIFTQVGTVASVRRKMHVLSLTGCIGNGTTVRFGESGEAFMLGLDEIVETETGRAILNLHCSFPAGTPVFAATTAP
jgi:hypothetical protein